MHRTTMTPQLRAVAIDEARDHLSGDAPDVAVVDEREFVKSDGRLARHDHDLFGLHHLGKAAAVDVSIHTPIGGLALCARAAGAR